MKNIVIIFFFILSNTILFSFRLPFDYFPQIKNYFAEPHNNEYFKGVKFYVSNFKKLPVRTAQRGTITEIIVLQKDNFKGIKIRFENGMTGFYGNLYDFSPRLTDYISEKGYDLFRDNFVLEIHDNNLRVKHNEVIGFVSNMHNEALLFKLQDKDDNYLNPLRHFDIPVSFKPVFHKISILPYNHSSKINNSNDKIELRLMKTSPKDNITYYNYRSENELFLNGKYMLNIFAAAISEKFSKANIISYMKIYVNEQLIRETYFERINNLPPSGISYNPNFGYDYYSYPEFFDTDKFRKGKNEFKIEITDMSGNKSFASFEYTNLDNLELALDLTQEIIYTNIPFKVIEKNGRILKKADIYISADYYTGRWELYDGIEINNHQFEYNINLSKYKYNKLIFKVVVKDNYNREKKIISPLLNIINYNEFQMLIKHPEFTVKKNDYLNSKEIVVETKNILAANPEMFFLKNNEIIKKTELNYYDFNKYNFIIEDGLFENGFYQVKIFLKDLIGNEMSYLLDININFINKATGGNVRSDDNKAVLKISEQSITEEVVNYSLISVQKKIIPPNLIFASNVYEINPEYVYYRTPPLLSIRSDFDLNEDLEKISLYMYVKEKENWEIIESLRDDIWFSANINYNGVYALLLDNSPPVVTGFGPVSLIKNNQSEIYVKFVEDGAGIDIDNTTFKINGRDVIFRYNRNNNFLYFQPNFYWIPKQINTVEIFLIDKAGNKSDVKNFSFYLN